MLPRKLSSIIVDLDPKRIVGDADPIVRGLAYDSREVEAGFLFYALEGLHTDGHLFIDQAISRGAVAVIHSRPLADYREGIVYVEVSSARLSMSPSAASYYDHPSRGLVVVGVTGTEGKSSTVFFIYQLLSLAGQRAGFLSTVLSRTGDGERVNPKHQTTPEAPEVQGMLDEMRENGMEFAIVEASSHGLSPRTGRLADVDFDVGVMTNVTHEHLEFHGTWQQYRADKANLFRALDRSPAERGGHDRPGEAEGRRHRKNILGAAREIPSFGVVNLDDPSADYFARATTMPVYGYSVGRPAGSDAPPGASLRARAIEGDSSGIRFEIVEGERSYPARLPFPGSFNVSNVLAALIVASRITERPTAEFLELLWRLRPLPGRMTRIVRGQPFDLLVDYAHTPSSFETVLSAARAETAGRLIAVFGSGGERDRQKRSLQGEVADRYCDLIVLADEDPRGEPAMTILEEIAAGVTRKRLGEGLLLIPDRLEAIRTALGRAAAGDRVLLLGKGHESTIIYANGTIPWDEVAAAERCLAELGFPGRG